jgi:prepilin-type processing-associated H-X9-DG protein
LAVVTILCLLAGFLLPALQVGHHDGRRTQCLSNVRQAAQAGIAFSARHLFLPRSRSWASKSLGPNDTFPAESTENPEQLAYTWVQPLLVDLDNAGAAAALEAAARSAQPAFGVRLPFLICPSDTDDTEGTATLSYAINAGRINCDAKWTNHDWKANGGSNDALRSMRDTGAYRRNRIAPRDLVDGASYTIAFAENFYLRTWCVDPQAQPPVTAITEFHSGIIWDPNVASFPKLPPHNSSVDRSGGVSHGSTYAHPSSRHPGGFNMAMWDGSARFVSNSIDYTVYARLMSSDGSRTQDHAQQTSPAPRQPGRRRKFRKAIGDKTNRVKMGSWFALQTWLARGIVQEFALAID